MKSVLHKNKKCLQKLYVLWSYLINLKFNIRANISAVLLHIALLIATYCLTNWYIFFPFYVIYLQPNIKKIDLFIFFKGNFCPGLKLINRMVKIIQRNDEMNCYCNAEYFILYIMYFIFFKCTFKVH